MPAQRRTSRVFLRLPTRADEAAFLQHAQRSRSLHAPWTSAPCTPAQYADYLARMEEPANLGFLVCLGPGPSQPHEMTGVINLSQIVHGNFRSAYLGFYAFEGYTGQGLMRDGLSQLVAHAFRKLRLHRLEANIQPGNTASIALVRACGFSQEGLSPRYLKIGGRWRDHERWAIVAP